MLDYEWEEIAAHPEYLALSKEDRDKIRGKAWVIYWSWDGPADIRFSRIGHLVR